MHGISHFRSSAVLGKAGLEDQTVEGIPANQVHEPLAYQGIKTVVEAGQQSIGRKRYLLDNEVERMTPTIGSPHVPDDFQ